jgi:hypothetical protein
MKHANVSPDGIDYFRKGKLQHIVSTLVGYLTLYQETKYKCSHDVFLSFECGAAHSSSIVKQ